VLSDSRRTARWGVLLVAVCVVAAGAARPHAQRGQPDPLMRIWTGVYAGGQAERGQTAFAGACASCHSADLGGGSGPPVNRLFRTIKDDMPRNAPGTLDDATVTDLVAFILRQNGFPPSGGSTVALHADKDALEGIVLVPRAGPTKVPNFALVQLAGCLVQTGDRSWLLAETTEPRSAKDTPPTDAEIRLASAGMPGTGRFKLVSARPFAPEKHAGEEVFLKGIINRSPVLPLLNVTALAPTGTRCGQ
jgi:hypothetical protein